MRLPATAALAALLIAGSALAEKVDLRGPAPQAGQTLQTTTDTESEQGNLSMTVQGQVVDGQMSTKSHQEIVTKILEVTDGEVTKVETTFVKSKSVNTMNVFGQEQEQEDTNLEGLVMTQTKTEDGWQTEAKGGQLPQEAKDMMKKAGYADQRHAFPAEPVEVGHKWELEGEQIGAFMGQGSMPGAKFDGEMEFELIEVKEVNGKKVAVIEYELDGKIIIEMLPQGMQMDLDINMKGEGLIERDLSAYTNNNVFEGDMDFSMAMNANGQPIMNMTAKMPVKTSATQEAQ